MKKSKPWIYIGQTSNGIKKRYKEHLNSKPEAKECNILVGVYNRIKNSWRWDAVKDLEQIYINKFTQLAFWEVGNTQIGNSKSPYFDQRHIEFIDSAFSYFQIISVFQEESKDKKFIFPDFKPRLFFEKSFHSLNHSCNRPVSLNSQVFLKEDIDSKKIPVYIKTKSKLSDYNQKRNNIKAFFFPHRPKQKNFLLLENTLFWTNAPNVKNSKPLIKLWKKLADAEIIKINFHDNYMQDDTKYTMPFQITFLKDYLTSVSAASNIILAKWNSGWYDWKDKNGEVLMKYRKQPKTAASE